MLVMLFLNLLEYLCLLYDGQKEISIQQIQKFQIHFN